MVSPSSLGEKYFTWEGKYGERWGPLFPCLVNTKQGKDEIPCILLPSHPNMTPIGGFLSSPDLGQDNLLSEMRGFCLQT